MEQKTISRNAMFLYSDFEESFADQSFNSSVRMVVEEGDGECCVIRVFDDSINDCGDCVAFILGKEDAERFAQAILVFSGARKVV